MNPERYQQITAWFNSNGDGSANVPPPTPQEAEQWSRIQSGQAPAPIVGGTMRRTGGGVGMAAGASDASMAEWRSAGRPTANGPWEAHGANMGVQTNYPVTSTGILAPVTATGTLGPVPPAGGTTFAAPVMGGVGGGGNRMIESVTPAVQPRMRSARSEQLRAQHDAFMQQMNAYVSGRLGGPQAPFPRFREGGPPMMPGQPAPGPQPPFDIMPPGMGPPTRNRSALPMGTPGPAMTPLQQAEQRYLSSLARPDAYGNMDMDYGNDYLADVYRLDPGRAQQLASQGQRIASNYSQGQSYSPPSTTRPMQSSFPSRSMPSPSMPSSRSMPSPSSVLPDDFPF